MGAARAGFPRVDDLRRGHLGSVLGSLLGLLALLLSFTFAMSANRYDTRRQLVVNDANVLGGLYLQSSFLPDGSRQEFKHDLRQYVDLRVTVAALRHNVTAAQMAEAMVTSDAIFQRMWKVLRRRRARPAAGAQGRGHDPRIDRCLVDSTGAISGL